MVSNGLGNNIIYRRAEYCDFRVLSRVQMYEILTRLLIFVNKGPEFGTFRMIINSEKYKNIIIQKKN